MFTLYYSGKIINAVFTYPFLGGGGSEYKCHIIYNIDIKYENICQNIKKKKPPSFIMQVSFFLFLHFGPRLSNRSFQNNSAKFVKTSYPARNLYTVPYDERKPHLASDHRKNKNRTMSITRSFLYLYDQLFNQDKSNGTLQKGEELTCQSQPVSCIGGSFVQAIYFWSLCGRG